MICPVIIGGERLWECGNLAPDIWMWDLSRETLTRLTSDPSSDYYPVWTPDGRQAGQDVHFRRCPYCAELFQKEPEFYIHRLEGTIPHAGVLGHEECCVRPELDLA